MREKKKSIRIYTYFITFFFLVRRSSRLAYRLLDNCIEMIKICVYCIHCSVECVARKRPFALVLFKCHSSANRWTEARAFRCTQNYEIRPNCARLFLKMRQFILWPMLACVVAYVRSACECREPNTLRLQQKAAKKIINFNWVYNNQWIRISHVFRFVASSIVYFIVGWTDGRTLVDTLPHT